MVKGFLKFLEIVCCVFILIVEILEFLAIPAILVILGMICELPWEIMAVMVGGYFLLYALLEIICHFVFRALEKKYTPFVERIISRFVEGISSK